jgi:hypothetical protein
MSQKQGSLTKRAHEGQQTPYRSHSRNHGLCARFSSCLRLAAERSLGVSGLVSGTAKMRSSHSISAILCSTPIPVYNKPIEQPVDVTAMGRL